jgi:hypothetical protein
MIFDSFVIIVDQLPLENDLIVSLCQVLKAIAMNENNAALVASLMQTPSFMNLLTIYSNLSLLQDMSSSVAALRLFGQSLNYQGLSVITEVIGVLLIKGNGNGGPLFHQLSQMIFLSFETFFHHRDYRHVNYASFVSKILACLNGLAK